MEIPRCLCFSASGSQQQPASPSVINLWQVSHVGSSGQLQRGDESSSNVESSFLSGKRDRDIGSVSLSQHDKARIPRDRKNSHEYLENESERALQGECAAQGKLSEAQVEMDRKSRERRNSDFALYETNQQLESQRLKFYQANQWADQAQNENSRLFGELSMENRIYQAHHERWCQEVEGLRRSCRKQADKVRQLKIDELPLHQKENLSTVNQLLSHIQELQDKVNSLNEGKRIL